MKNRILLSKKEVVVVFLVISFLSMILGAGGDIGQVYSQRMICSANLRHWYRAMIDFTDDNEGYFWSGWSMTAPGASQWWMQTLEPYCNGPDSVWYCPTATEPRYNLDGTIGPGYDNEPFAAWGYYVEWFGEYSSSYGVNSWLEDAYSKPVPLSEELYAKFWINRDMVINPDTVPFMTDAQWADFWPEPHHVPPAFENTVWEQEPLTQFARVVQNRHGIGVQMSIFMDGSARPVGLKELWTLKWHRVYDTQGPWTLAGGVLPTYWPDWMQGFQDY